MSDLVTVVTDSTYADIVEKSAKPVVLAIGAQWCPDCRRLEPFFMEFAKRYGEKVLFTRCDFDSNPGLKEKFDVKHIPVIAVIKDGKVLHQIVEPKSVGPLKELVEKFLA